MADVLINWDARYYQTIIVHGYPRSSPQLSPFSPLYPAIARVVDDLTPGLGPEWAALLVSWASLIAAVWAITALTTELWPEAPRWRAGVFLAFCPVSVFLVAGYADGLFVALSAWCLVALVRSRPWLATLLALLVGLTRPEGVVLALSVGWWSWVHEPAPEPRRRVTLTAVRVLLSSLGAIGIDLFQWSRYGSPFEWLDVQRNMWFRRFTWPFHSVDWSLRRVFGPGGSPGSANIKLLYTIDDVAIVAAVAGLAWLVMLARRRKAPWWVLPSAVFVVVVVLMDAPGGQTPEAAARYAMTAVPLMALAGRVRRDLSWGMLIAVSASCAALLQGLFAIGGWVT